MEKLALYFNSREFAVAFRAARPQVIRDLPQRKLLPCDDPSSANQAEASDTASLPETKKRDANNARPAISKPGTDRFGRSRRDQWTC
jgi:hypothetical protein